MFLYLLVSTGKSNVFFLRSFVVILWIIWFSYLGLQKRSNNPSSYVPMCVSHFFLFLICILLLRSLQPKMNQPTPAGNLYNSSLLQISLHYSLYWYSERQSNVTDDSPSAVSHSYPSTFWILRFFIRNLYLTSNLILIHILYYF